MNNQELLNAKVRLYSELKHERGLAKNMAKHYLNIDATDFILDAVNKLLSIDEQIYETSKEIKRLREKLDDEVKDIL